LEVNQNTNEQGKPKEAIPLNTQKTSEPETPEILVPASEEATLETPTYVPEQQISNQQPQIDSMEVHKHPHHVMHKKKWSEYLLEFFMLFLAVFLGFIAENIRENVAEHEREKKYAEHLLLDLRSDSSIIGSRIEEFKQRQKDQTNFFKIISSSQKPSDSAVILSFLPLLRTWNPEFTTATYNQMKTSGGLRYIRKEVLTAELQKYYDVLLPRIDREITDLRKVFTELIVPYLIKHFKLQEFTESGFTGYTILNRTSESDQELINIMAAYGGGWDTVLALDQINLKQTLKLIEMVRKEYRLK
jgi:phosphoenolpyruvate synthase/pyruvate phosphate dikinase